MSQPATTLIQGKIIIIDDEVGFVSTLSKYLTHNHYQVTSYTEPRKMLAILPTLEVDVVLTDIQMPDISGIQLCHEIKKTHPEVEVIVMTGMATIENAVEAMKAGAYDFLVKPFESLEIVKLDIAKAIEHKHLLHRTKYLESQVELRDRFDNILGANAKMKNVFRLIEGVAPSDATVMLLGESGTGKELVARAIHERSARKNKRFLAINCAAFNESLLESELFGHVRGAFTGAAHARRGLFEEADGGTLFLDEIGETMLSIQAKLLRVLQEGEIRPVGSNENRKVDVRIITATNINLAEAVKENKFREDLYYRINVVPIVLPPLRERKEDIPLLVHHFIKKYAKKLNKTVTGIDPLALSMLTSYRWPGNVRELENMLERLVVLSHTDIISNNDLPENIRSLAEKEVETHLPALDLPFSVARQQVLESFDRRYITDALLRAGGVVAEAARLAHMDRSNFRRLLKQYNIDSADFEV